MTHLRSGRPGGSTYTSAEVDRTRERIRQMPAQALRKRHTRRDSRVLGSCIRLESEERQKRDARTRTAVASRIFRSRAPGGIRPADRLSGTEHPDALGWRIGACGG